jgi:hypothetical protein
VINQSNSKIFFDLSNGLGNDELRSACQLSQTQKQVLFQLNFGLISKHPKFMISSLENFFFQVGEKRIKANRQFMICLSGRMRRVLKKYPKLNELRISLEAEDGQILKRLLRGEEVQNRNLIDMFQIDSLMEKLKMKRSKTTRIDDAVFLLQTAASPNEVTVLLAAFDRIPIETLQTFPVEVIHHLIEKANPDQKQKLEKAHQRAVAALSFQLRDIKTCI